MANSDEIKVGSRVWSEVHKKEGRVCFPIASVTAAIKFDDGSKLLCRKKELKVVEDDNPNLGSGEWERWYAPTKRVARAKKAPAVCEDVLEKVVPVKPKEEDEEPTTTFKLTSEAEEAFSKVVEADVTPVQEKPTSDVVENPKEFDAVERPEHYASERVECIDAMEQVYGKQAVINFCMCNAFKYNWRADLKNGDEDLAKARWYMKKAKELINR